MVVCTNYEQHGVQYKNMQAQYKQIKFIPAKSTLFYQDFKTLLINDTATFIFFITDSSSLENRLSLNKYMKLLAKTGAYGCYWKPTEEFNKNITLFEQLDDQVYAWQYALNKTEYVRNPHTVDLSLFRKESIMKILLKHPCNEFQHFVESLKRTELHERAVGLCVCI